MNFASRNKGRQNSSQNQRHYSTSGWVTPSIVGLLCLILVAAAIERGKGNLQKIRTRVDPPIATETSPAGPGGQEAIHLTRSATSVGQGAELLSVTLLPGRGMNVFQITAMIPGHGEVPLLVSPSLTDAAKVLSGEHEDANGLASTTLGGAILLPWAQSLSGTPTATPGILETTWEGKRLTFPAANARTSMSVEGLLLNRGADSVKSDVLPDGQSAQAVFHAGDFSGNWASNIEVTVLAELTAHDLDLTVTAKNVGQQPAPFGIGWQPLFAIPGDERSSALLTIPSQSVIEIDRRTGRPTGKSVQVDDTSLDFSHSRGTRLGLAGIDQTYTGLRPGAGSGPVAELSDPAYNMKVSVIPLSAGINSMRVIAPADKSWISIGPNTNLDDPFGSEWGDPQNAGMVTLAPGASLKWKVRLEISLLGTSAAAQ
jgi:galactose mutarotase-like enzyme